MKFKPTIESTMLGLKVILSAFACWPLPPDAKPSHVRWYNRWWWFLFTHLIVSGFFVTNTLYLNLDNSYLAIKVTTELCLLGSNLLKMVFSKVGAPRLQRLLAELEEFLKQATDKERQLIQRYVDRCVLYFVVTFVILLFANVAIIIATRASSQPLIQNSTHPFSIEPFWIWAILYSFDCMLMLHSDAMLILTLEYTILLWVTAGRFEVMCSEFQNAMNVDDLKRCVRKHQRLIEYTESLNRVTGIMALHTISLAIFGATTGGFMLVYSNPEWWEVVEYIMYYMASGMIFHMLAWPADNLMDTSEKVLRSVYNSAWIDKPEMLRDALIIGQRSHSPIVIAIGGLLPALSLESFASGVSTTFSYLAVLRAVAGNEKNPEKNLRSQEDFNNLLYNNTVVNTGPFLSSNNGTLL